MDERDIDSLKMFFIIIIGVILIIFIPLFVLDYFSSCKKVEIYNSLNDTNYSCSDFFWASNQINKTTQTIKLEQ